MTLLHVEVFSRDGGCCLAPAGELDVSTVELLKAELARVERDRPEVVIMDLRGLSFMDSTGLHLLIEAAERARADGRRFALAKGQDQVMRVLEVTRLAERFDIVPDPGALLGAGRDGDGLRSA